jgi:hypothetical protein
MGREHNNIWCDRYGDKVIHDERENCSLCGASLHELTLDEAIKLVDKFEDLALERTRKESWRVEDWLFDDEAEALAIAIATAVSARR